MKEKMKNQCTLERQGEKFIVEVPEGGKGATVTDRFGVVITIKYGSGHFDTRLPNRWGGWKNTMPEAVDYAISLFSRYRGQPKEEEAYKQMQDYVKNCK